MIVAVAGDAAHGPAWCTPSGSLSLRLPPLPLVMPVLLLRGACRAAAAAAVSLITAVTRLRWSKVQVVSLFLRKLVKFCLLTLR